MRTALYARVSTTDQNCEQQLSAIREYVTLRGWTIAGEYIDHGVSGTRDSRPELNKLMTLAKKRQIDAIACWKLDRWGRSVQHLVNSIRELSDLGVRFVAVTQGIDIDKSNPMAKLLMHMLAAFAEFERDLIVERTHAGLDRARKQGRIGGRPRAIFNREKARRMREEGLSEPKIAETMGVSVMTINRLLKEVAG